jgi:hypothetical protein
MIERDTTARVYNMFLDDGRRRKVATYVNSDNINFRLSHVPITLDTVPLRYNCVSAFKGEGWLLTFVLNQSWHKREEPTLSVLSFDGDRDRFEEDWMTARLAVR